MLGIKAKFDHVAHGTRSIRSLLPLYRDLLGGEFVGAGENPRVGFRSVQLAFANGNRVELLEATEGSTFLDSFFRRTGDGGLHHVTFKVDDINVALEAALANGFDPFGVYLEQEFWQEFFLHPKSAGGALVQLAASPFEMTAELRPPMTLDEYLDNPRNYWEG